MKQISHSFRNCDPKFKEHCLSRSLSLFISGPELLFLDPELPETKKMVLLFIISDVTVVT